MADRAARGRALFVLAALTALLVVPSAASAQRAGSAPQPPTPQFIFAQFVAYSASEHSAENDWKLVTVTWNTNVLEAWPPSLWSR